MEVPPGEEAGSQSADQFVAEQQRVMRDVYTVVRGNLQQAADRRKKNNDIRVRPAQFKEGDRVWYYCPRRYAQRSPKWQNRYIGPYEVIRILPPSHAVIRKTRKSQPFVVHLDKLKECTTTPSTRAQEPVRKSRDWVFTPAERVRADVGLRPRRSTRKPQHLRDFI